MTRMLEMGLRLYFQRGRGEKRTNTRMFTGGSEDCAIERMTEEWNNTQECLRSNGATALVARSTVNESTRMK